MEKLNCGAVNPLVSICCATYNHAPYIRQCLDGFVMQKTNFPVEILIHDDASTDGTQDIVREYEQRYPDLIKPIYQTENQYSKGVKVSLVYNYSRARGKYIALCEGDDYWTDPYKLQKQVDFLENHPDYVMCSHRWDEFIEEKKETIYGNPMDVKQDSDTYCLNDFVHGKWCCQPLTVVYRFNALNIKDYKLCKKAKDITLFYMLLKQGKGYCFSDVMATYRNHAKGVWSGSSLNDRRLQDFLVKRAIYDVEHTNEAAIFILCEFTKLISRLWMIRHIIMFCQLYFVFVKHWGFMFTSKLYFDKFVLNKLFSFKEENI